MCRFTLYLGPAVRLSSLLFEPDHSLIHQSTHSRERSEPLNGDGFGIGWYAPDSDEEPAVFRSTTPAWNNRNLASLSKVVSSRCMLAHVRAATNLSGVNEANCHPFRFGRYLFMHNGDVAGFRNVRRALLESVCDEAFNNVYGSTDSEHVFALVIDELLQLPESDAATCMTTALQRAIQRTVELVREHTGDEPSYMNFALSDGEVAVVSRYTTDTEGEPESLYMYHGDYPLANSSPKPHATQAEPVVLISSERLSEDPGWVPIPANHLMVVGRGREPFLMPCDPRRTIAEAA